MWKKCSIAKRVIKGILLILGVWSGHLIQNYRWLCCKVTERELTCCEYLLGPFLGSSTTGSNNCLVFETQVNDDWNMGLSKKETCLRGRGRGRVAEIKPYFL